MKLIILNKDDSNGGAARAAKSLQRTMLSFNIDSTLVLEKKYNLDLNTISSNSKILKIYNTIKLYFDIALLNILYPKRKKYPWGLNIFPTGINKTINQLNPDIVNMHWVSAETISWNEIAKINAPIVWTMHDMWALTGGCHYTYGCDKYLSQCSRCPQLESKNFKDISYKIFNKKKNLLKKKNITIIASSKWLHDCFKQSPLYKDLPIYIVPNPINLKVFKPIDKILSRKILNLPTDKKLILFMAFSPTTDTRKGVQFFPEMLSELSKKYSKDEIDLVIAGATHSGGNIKTNFDLHFFGVLNDEWSLVLLYSACDVLIAPSVQENLSNAVMESLACETPVVAFNIGGMPDMIKHKHNGYLAEPFKPIDLAAGIDFVLKTPVLKKNARDYVIENFSDEIVFNKLMPIFDSTIKNQNS